MNIVADEDPHVEDEEGSVYDPEGPIIGNNASGVYAIGVSSGRNNLVRMSCCDKQCMVLLDSGAFRSVVGGDYLFS